MSRGHLLFVVLFLLLARSATAVVSASAPTSAASQSLHLLSPPRQGEEGQAIAREDWIAHIPLVLFYVVVILLLNGVAIYFARKRLRSSASTPDNR